MTPVSPAVIIRPSRGGLVFMVAWIGFLCLLMVMGAVGEHDPRGLLLVFVWLPWLVPVMLGARVCVTATGDTLIYRSLFRTRSWHRREIQGFTMTPGRWSYRTLRLEMHTVGGHRIPFAITAASWRRDNPIEDWRSALEDWLTGADEGRSN